MSPAAHDMTPDAFWRSLGFFSIYRLLIGLLFLFAVWTYGDTLSLATQNLALFVRANSAYLTVGVVFLALLWRRSPGFDLQLSLQVAADVGFLTVMMFASGGQRSGIALLLLVVLAGAGLVGQGRMTLFYAALASVALLMEQSWRALTHDADAADFFRTGLTCIAFFGTAVMARLLARRVVANEELARHRGLELDRQLQVSERIIRDMGDGVLVVDEDGVVRQSNPGADRLLGSETACKALSQVSAALAERLPGWSAGRREATEILRGTVSPLRVRYLPPPGTGGSALIYLEDLDKVQAQAQQFKLAALGRLTANIAHEIRNPLAAISHAAELLAEEEMDPVRSRLATIVGDNTRRLNRLVTDVLELGRRDRAETELISWAAFSGGLLEELALDDSSATVRVIADRQDGNIRFDRAHLHRVLWNLLSNALRYASGNPGAIHLTLQPQAAPGRAVITVADDGPGVDPALRAQVFEPFFTTRSSGTGLGLYIARELCEANGALLELLASPSGAHFRITVRSQP